MYYAQITGGIVVAVTQASGVIDAPDMVQIATFDISLLGKTYDGGVFT